MNILSSILNHPVTQSAIGSGLAKAVGQAVNRVKQSRQETAQTVNPPTPSNSDSHHENKETRKAKYKFELRLSKNPKFVISMTKDKVIEKYNLTLKNSNNEDKNVKAIDIEG